MTNAVDTFAEWRWKTLANVTKYLCRVHEAVVAAIASISCATQLASGPDGQASVFLSSAQDGAFWSKARALGLLTKPITDMSSWLGGCECHEAERQRGQTIKCGWAGCRAPQLASRVAETLRQLENVRDQVSGQTDGVSHAATTVMGTLEMKMAWVNDLSKTSNDWALTDCLAIKPVRRSRCIFGPSHWHVVLADFCQSGHHTKDSKPRTNALSRMCWQPGTHKARGYR